MSTTSRRGLFLTFEGLDGCGKTTQMRLLAARLRAAGETVVETVEPGGTRVGTAIRRILLDPANRNLSPTAEMMLFFAARAQNLDEIVAPATARGEIVMADRWTDSTWAYQGFGRGLGTEAVVGLDKVACRGREPDLTFWIDVDLETSIERAQARNIETDFTDTRLDDEGRAFFSTVLEGYRRLAEAQPLRVVRIDGRGSEQEVAERVRAAYEAFRSRHV